MAIPTVQKSGLRQILENVARAKARGNNTLNLSIGNPAFIPEVAEIWRDMAHRALDADFDTSLGEYGSAGGSAGLVEHLIGYFDRTLGWSLKPDNIVIAPGSQTLCYLAVKTFCGPSQPLVLPFLPDYAGYMGLGGGAVRTIGIPALIQRRDTRRFAYTPDFSAIDSVGDVGMYLYSDPSNPSTSSISAADRDQLIEMAARRDAMVVVDNAYGSPFPIIAAPKNQPVHHPRVINLFSCSKMGLPGARLGFAVGPAEQITQLNSAISNSVLQAPGLPQRMLSEAIASSVLEDQIRALIAPHYREKRTDALHLMHQVFPDDLPWSVCDTADGMFLWLRVESDDFDDLDFYQRAQDAGVFVTPGRFFFSEGQASDTSKHKFIRLSLSAPTTELMDGIQTLSTVLQNFRSAPDVPQLSAASM